MPVLPFAFERSFAATSSDSRILEARQFSDSSVGPSAISTLTTSLRALLRRTVASAAATTTTTTSIPNASPTLLPRQQGNLILVIPSQYAGLRSGPAPGAVVGIVLGSIVAFLLILWLLWVATNGPLAGGLLVSSAYVAEDVSVVASTRRTRRSKAAPRPEMSQARSPARRPAERVIRTERIVRDVSRPPPPREERSRVRETIIVDERPPSIRRVPGDDIVEVIEEHSDLSPPPTRGKSRRGSYRSVQRDFYD